MLLPLNPLGQTRDTAQAGMARTAKTEKQKGWDLRMQGYVVWGETPKARVKAVWRPAVVHREETFNCEVKRKQERVSVIKWNSLS